MHAAYRFARNPARIIMLTLAAAIAAVACVSEPGDTTGKTLELVRQWVHGSYNNVAQFEADMAADLPPEEIHRPMYQLFVPVDAPQLEGYIVYQQSSMDGSENPAMIFRHGLMQYIPDPASDALLQRELYFKDSEPYKNLHKNPALLNNITIDDLTWDAGCDFYLRVNKTQDEVSGPLIKGACTLFNAGTQQNMYANDRVEITATEYRFKGVFEDAEGNVVWGTGSDELNTLQRQ